MCPSAPLTPPAKFRLFSNLAYMKVVLGELEESFKSLEACVNVIVRYPGLVRFRCANGRFGEHLKGRRRAATIVFLFGGPTTLLLSRLRCQLVTCRTLVGD